MIEMLDLKVLTHVIVSSKAKARFLTSKQHASNARAR